MKTTTGIFTLPTLIFCLGFLQSTAQNIGINTNSPTTNLDINGTVRIRGGSPGLGKVLVSDGSGTASWKASRIGFRAKGIESSGLANIANNTWYRLYLKEESYDYAGGFNLEPNSADRSTFTAPVNGLYHFTANTLFNYRISNGSYIQYNDVMIRLRILRNGVTSTYTMRRYEASEATFMVAAHIADDIRLFTGDKIWIEVYQFNQSATTMPMETDMEYASFACHLVFEE
ncbi:MAG: hypothetical protein MUE99_08980 [Chitinophagaceae bacterium]|jgi:hypothetical protein|nr:hypothetical protein [Chitinophagaceae bacterium]